MQLYCAKCGAICLVVTPDKTEPKQFRPGSVMVCRSCYDCYKASDEVTQMARKQAQNDPTVEKLMGIFNMK